MLIDFPRTYFDPPDREYSEVAFGDSAGGDSLHFDGSVYVCDDYVLSVYIGRIQWEGGQTPEDEDPTSLEINGILVEVGRVYRPVNLQFRVFRDAYSIRTKVSGKDYHLAHAKCIREQYEGDTQSEKKEEYNAEISRSF